jgi:hypothetical protein
MLYREIMFFHCENVTENINTVCERNAELLVLNLVAYVVTTKL